MAPMLDIAEKDFGRAKGILDLATIRNISTPDFGFIYVPSINLWVAKEKEERLFGRNFIECTKRLHSKGKRMPKLPEFIEFLNYCKINFPEVYDKVTKGESAEWIDAELELKEGIPYRIRSHGFHFSGEGIIERSSIIDKDALIEEKNISLEDYLVSAHNNQGLPTKNVKSGKFLYRPLKSTLNNYISNNSVPNGYNQVARFFGAEDKGLLIFGDPTWSLSNFSARVVIEHP